MLKKEGNLNLSLYHKNKNAKTMKIKEEMRFYCFLGKAIFNLVFVRSMHLQVRNMRLVEFYFETVSL